MIPEKGNDGATPIRGSPADVAPTERSADTPLSVEALTNERGVLMAAAVMPKAVNRRALTNIVEHRRDLPLTLNSRPHDRPAYAIRIMEGPQTPL